MEILNSGLHQNRSSLLCLTFQGGLSICICQISTCHQAYPSSTSPPELSVGHDARNTTRECERPSCRDSAVWSCACKAASEPAKWLRCRSQNRISFKWTWLATGGNWTRDLVEQAAQFQVPVPCLDIQTTYSRLKAVHLSQRNHESVAQDASTVYCKFEHWTVGAMIRSVLWFKPSSYFVRSNSNSAFRVSPWDTFPFCLQRSSGLPTRTQLKSAVHAEFNLIQKEDQEADLMLRELPRKLKLPAVELLKRRHRWPWP